MRTRRIVARVVVCAILGAVTSVATGWIILWLEAAGVVSSQSTAVTITEGDWSGRLQSGFGSHGQSWVFFPNDSLRRQILDVRRRNPGAWAKMEPTTFPNGMAPWALLTPDMHGAPVLGVIKSGWPARAHRCTIYAGSSWGALASRAPPGAFNRKPRVAGGFFVRGSMITLPYAPLWRPWAINTIFWGALWFPALIAPGMIRRARRRRRGICPACAYDLKGLMEAGCPECGWGREGRGGTVERGS